MFSTTILLLVLIYSGQRLGCLSLINSSTLTVRTVSKRALWAPVESIPFKRLKLSSFIDLLPLLFNSVFKISSSIANAALTIFNASCLTLPEVLVR